MKMMNAFVIVVVLCRKTVADVGTEVLETSVKDLGTAMDSVWTCMLLASS